jgi:iron(III) transport system permease protein
MPNASRWRYPVLAALALFFVLFLALPLGYLLVQAFSGPSGPGLSRFRDAFTDRALGKSLVGSLKVSAASAGISTLLALALTISLRASRAARLLRGYVRTVVTAPMLLPTLTYGFVIMYSFGKQGLITRIIGHEVFPVYGFFGLLLAYVLYTLPSAFLIIDDAAGYVDRKLAVVSALMGDSWLRGIWTSWVRPLIAPVGGAFILSFVLSFTDYGIPAAIGGTFPVLATHLYDTILGSVPDFGKGAVLTVVLMVPAAFGFAILKYLDRFTAHSERASSVGTREHPASERLMKGFAIALTLGIVAVFAVMFVIPFVVGYPYAMRFTFANFASALATNNLVVAFRNSLVVSLVTAIAGTLIAFLAATFVVRSGVSKAARRLVDAAAMLCNTIPGMVIGVSYLLLFGASPLKRTFVILAVSNVIHFFSTPYLMARNAISRMNPAWDTAASLLGDSRLKTVLRIIVPNSTATIYEMMTYFFVNSMVTVSAVIFLVGTKTMLMTTKINELQYFMRYEDVFVLSLVIFAANMAVKASVYAYRRSKAIDARKDTEEGD